MDDFDRRPAGRCQPQPLGDGLAGRKLVAMRGQAARPELQLPAFEGVAGQKRRRGGEHVCPDGERQQRLNVLGEWNQLGGRVRQLLADVHVQADYARPAIEELSGDPGDGVRVMRVARLASIVGARSASRKCGRTKRYAILLANGLKTESTVRARVEAALRSDSRSPLRARRT